MTYCVSQHVIIPPSYEKNTHNSEFFEHSYGHCDINLATLTKRSRKKGMQLKETLFITINVK